VQGRDRAGRDYVDRNVFHEIRGDSWKWRKDRSFDGGKTWVEGVSFIEAHRSASGALPWQPVVKVRPRRGRIFSARSALPNLGIPSQGWTARGWGSSAGVAEPTTSTRPVGCDACGSAPSGTHIVLPNRPDSCRHVDAIRNKITP